MTKYTQILLACIVVIGINTTSGLSAEDSLPPRALARIGDHRFYHGPNIVCAALSPDGRHIATTGSCFSHAYFATSIKWTRPSNAILLWDATTGQRLREIGAPIGPIEHMAFSPDSTRLAVAFYGKAENWHVGLFDSHTGKLLRRFGPFKQSIKHLKFSPDGKYLRTSETEGIVSSWDIASGKRVRLWKPPSRKESWYYAPSKGVLSPKARWIIWFLPEAHSYRIGSSVFIGDSKTVCFRVLDAQTGKSLYDKTMATELRALTFSPDGKQFATHTDKIIIWDTATGKKVTSLSARVTHAAVSPDWRTVLTVNTNSQIQLWDLKTNTKLRDLAPGLTDWNSKQLIMASPFSAEGKKVLLATKTTLRLFETATGKELVVPTRHRAPVSLRFSPDGQTLLTTCEELRCAWKTLPGKQPILLTRQSRKVWRGSDTVVVQAYSPDRRVFLEKSRANICIRDTTTGRVVHTLGGMGHADAYKFSPNGKHLLFRHVGDARSRLFSKNVYLWSVQTGKTTGQNQFGSFGTEVVFSPDSRFIAWYGEFGKNHNVHLHSAITGKRIRKLWSRPPFGTADCEVDSVFFSADSKWLIVRTSPKKKQGNTKKTVAENNLFTHIFDVQSGKEIFRFPSLLQKGQSTFHPSCVACSPDRRLLTLDGATTGLIRLIEIHSGVIRAEFLGHRDGVKSLAFSPDGRMLASGGEDNVVILWDVTGGYRKPAKTAITKAHLAKCWRDLLSTEPNRAGDAMALLIRHPKQAVPFLKTHLVLTSPEAINRLKQLLTALDSKRYRVRVQASQTLIALGTRSLPALQHALRTNPTLEVKLRIDNILDKIALSLPSPDTLRKLRTIEVLEHIGTKSATAWLDTLAHRDPVAVETHHAKAALARLAKRR